MEISLTITDLLRRLLVRKDGNVALLFAFAVFPLSVAVGGAIDYSRVTRVRAAAQVAADAAVLAAATMQSDDVPKMRLVAEKVLRSAFDETKDGQLTVEQFSYKAEAKDLSMRVSGTVPTSFLNLICIERINYGVETSAVRAVPDQTEVVLVLDNTWSMEGAKIAALKQAADDLVVTLTKDPKSTVKIGLVPYADYVNVGTSNRSQSWLKVPVDYDNVHLGSCWMQDQTCRSGTKKTCTQVVDGIPGQYDCTPSICTPVKPYQVCSGGWTEQFRWYGCVGSRVSGDLRLSDDEPMAPYPGILGTSQNCLNPIVPLTDSVNTVRSAIAGMVVNVGWYRPSTYIPAGLIWGLNVLSHQAPFSEGQPYEVDNKSPRKVMVLMTDGANTQRLNTGNGTHVDTYGAGLDQTYRDMTAICSNIKKKKILIYAVAFSVDDETSRRAMKSCATDQDHYFDAKDAQALNTAFRQIASSLSNLRLTR